MGGAFNKGIGEGRFGSMCSWSYAHFTCADSVIMGLLK